jgi:hypothetical protein
VDHQRTRAKVKRRTLKNEVNAVRSRRRWGGCFAEPTRSSKCGCRIPPCHRTPSASC